jgi:uncharacterized membrane protein
MMVLDKIFKLSQALRQYPLCHSNPTRSFWYHGRYFGLCARCTTMYIGGLIAFLTFPVWNGMLSSVVSLTLGSLLLVPGGIDGTTQMFGSRESNNSIRAITGFALGVGFPLIMYGILSLLY